LSVPLCGSIAGMGSGLTEGLFITPFERVKILLQNQKGSLKGRIRKFKNKGFTKREFYYKLNNHKDVADKTGFPKYIIIYILYYNYIIITPK
jgi:hypothetical protein